MKYPLKPLKTRQEIISSRYYIHSRSFLQLKILSKLSVIDKQNLSRNIYDPSILVLFTFLSGCKKSLNAKNKAINIFFWEGLLVARSEQR